MEKTNYTIMTIITRREKREALCEKLKALGLNGTTVTNVEGNGQQLGSITYTEAGIQKSMLIPKVMVEVIYQDKDTEMIIQEVCKLLKTNIMGDGKIFIEEIEGQIMKVRTRETNGKAL